MNKFKVDDCFVINRPLHFMHAIRESLGGVLEEYIGDCHYADNGVETFSQIPLLETPPIDKLSNSELEDWSEKAQLRMSRIMDSKLGNRGILSKRASYEDENEFRFAWKVSSNPEDKLLIDCSGALPYCKHR